MHVALPVLVTFTGVLIPVTNPYSRLGIDVFFYLSQSPAGSRITAKRGTRGALEIVIPPAATGDSNTWSGSDVLPEIGFAATWTAFTGMWTYGKYFPITTFCLCDCPYTTDTFLFTIRRVPGPDARGCFILSTVLGSKRALGENRVVGGG
jgi:hypothetical protein